MTATVRRWVVIAGRVQGVGFRAYCADVAGRLGVSGYVRNLADGRVEVAASGAPEAVEQLTEWCRKGPPAARVDGLTITDDAGGGETINEATGFRISR